MAKLTSKKRKSLPKSDFAIPEKAPHSGSYPIPDKSHAKNALARVGEFGTAAEKVRVKSKVASKFPSIKQSGGKSSGSKAGNRSK